MKNNNKIYDRAFKENAVRLSYESNCIKNLEKELDIYAGSLSRWRKDYEKFGSESFPGNGNLRFSHEQKRIYLLEKKIKQLNLKFEILKNSRPYISQGKPMIFHFIKSNEKIYSIKQMCKVLGISEDTYRKWKNQFISERRKQKILLQEEITSIFFEFKHRYGSPRITIQLQNRGYKISSATVSKYMQELGLSSKSTKNKSLTSPVQILNV